MLDRKHLDLLASAEKTLHLEKAEHHILQPNDCSRLHKLKEAMSLGFYFHPAKADFVCGELATMKNAKVFVVKHDWYAALGDATKPGDPFILPFEACIFEFRISGNTVIVAALAEGDGISADTFVEGVGGVWISANAENMTELHRYCDNQMRAISVALDAQVAEHTAVRAPIALNIKRSKQGKLPLSDYHVIDLSRRHRAAPAETGTPTGRRVRLHFRRGHWRHFESSKTWINWMLVGNPDLGFIDKEYRI